MKKTTKNVVLIVLLLLCVSALVGVFAGCDKGPNNDDGYVITYYLSEDSAPYTKYVDNGVFYFDRVPTRNHCVFLGMYDSAVGGTQIVDQYGHCIVTIDRDMTLYAHWSYETCQIQFDAGEGTLADNLKTMSVVYESTVTSFPVPERFGYDFVGWFDENDTKYSDKGAVLSEKTRFNDKNYQFSENNTVILTARYVVKQYTLTFDYNDGTYLTETVKINHGDTLESVTLPTKDTGSREIIGWSTQRATLVPFAGTFTSDVTLYAIWSDYKVFKFYTDDTHYTEEKVHRGEEYTLATPTRNGYDFDGWYTSTMYSGNPVEMVTYYTAITVYYAKWSLVTYTITFETNGGDAVLGTLQYTVEDTVSLPSAGEKQYATFIGWCKKQDLSDSPITALTKGTYGNLTLYAKWRGMDVSVNLDAGEGTIASAKRTVEYGASFSLGVPVRDGYEFQGWYTADNTKLTDKQGNSLGVWTIITQDTTLHAEYLKKYYVSVSYSHNNAGVVNVKDYYVAGEQVTLSVSIKDQGYDFVGFYRDNEIVTSSTEYSFVMTEEDVNISVTFEAKEFNVTLNSDGGYLNTTSVTVKYSETFSLPIPFKQGYIFDGWIYQGNKITDANGKGLTQWNITNDAVVQATYVVDPDAANKTLIYDTNTFLAIANGPSKTYVLASDIDMSGVTWTPFDFSGSIIGNGFTIKNLTISSSSGDLGLFLQMSGTIRNLVFENVLITSTSYNKVAIGTVCAILSGTIENVEIKSGALTSDIADIGGIAGRITGGAVRNCINRATLDGNKTENDGSTGGIVGLQTGGTVENGKNYGAITGRYNTGGVVGSNNNSAAIVKNSENYGSVTGRVNTGGIVGKAAHATSLENVTNEGTVTGTNYTAGVAGRFDNFAGNVTFNSNLVNRGNVTGEDYVGGITGYIYDFRSMGYASCDHTVTITRFTNSGIIKGNNYVGGLIGYIKVNADHSGSNTSVIKITASGLTNTGNVTGTSYVGGLIGYGYSNNTSSTLTGCSSSAVVTAEYYLGGLVGKIENVALKDCSNAGTIINATGYLVDGTTYYAYVGGYAGYGYSFENCNNAQAILYTERGQYVGGVVGYGVGALTGCANTANISATNANCVGGIAGRLNYAGNVTLNALTNTAIITGKDYVGGMVGYLYDYRSMGYNSCDHTVTLTRFTNGGNVSGGNNVGGLIGYIKVYADHSGSNTSVIKITGSNLTNTGNVTGTSYIGGLIGYGYSNNTSSTLTGCSSSAAITAEYYVGGIAGKIENVKMIECSNEGSTVTATGYLVEGTTYYAYVGGYAGYGYAFENCSNAEAIVYTQRGQYVGGIVGYGVGALTGCTNTANVTATNANCVGGIAGRLDYAGDVTLSALDNQGDVIGKDYVGGIVGYLYDYRSMGYNSCNNTVTLTKLINSGRVNGNDYVAGLIGYVKVHADHSGSNTSVIKITGSNLTNTGDVTGASYVGGLIGYGYSNNSSSLIVGYEASGTVNGSGSYVGNTVGKVENITLDA